MRLVFVLCVFSLPLCVHGQAGAYINGGLVWGSNQFDGITPDGKHQGVRAGIDASLFAGNMFFLPGIHYMLIDFDTGGDSFTSHNTPMQIIKGRFGLGFILFQRNKIKIRSRLQASMNWMNNAHTIQLSSSKFNEAYAGADLGLGISLGAFTMDFEYEKGFINAAYQIPKSKFDFFYATLGFFF